LIRLLDAQTEDEDELRRLRDPLVVWTKSDLAAPPEGEVGVSISTRGGVDRFLSMLDRVVRERWAPPEGSATVVNERQRAALEECADGPSCALDSLRGGAQEEIVAVDLYRAANALGSLTGSIARDDIYREIFSRFCIGK